ERIGFGSEQSRVVIEADEVLQLVALEGLLGDDAEEMDPLAEVPGSSQRIASVEGADDRKLPAIVADPPISGPFRNGAGAVGDLTAIDAIGSALSSGIDNQHRSRRTLWLRKLGRPPVVLRLADDPFDRLQRLPFGALLPQVASTSSLSLVELRLVGRRRGRY